MIVKIIFCLLYGLFCWACDQRPTLTIGATTNLATPLAQKPTVKIPNLDTLEFDVTGDHRGKEINRADSYPLQVVRSIFSAIDKTGADFVVDTGDYVFVDRGCPQKELREQVDLFLSARHLYHGKVYFLTGNHEVPCVSVMGVLGEGPLYWWFMVEDSLGRKAKFVAIATDVWSPAQRHWLQEVMATPTEYTFIFRHQYWGARGVKPYIDAEIRRIVEAFPYTLFIAGHEHKYEHVFDWPIRGEYRGVISGNGGAPFRPDWEKWYGFLGIKIFGGRAHVVAYEVTPGSDSPPIARERFSVSR